MRIGERSILYLSMYYACAQILIINHPDHSHGHRNKKFPPSHVSHHQAGKTNTFVSKIDPIPFMALQLSYLLWIDRRHLGGWSIKNKQKDFSLKFCLVDFCWKYVHIGLHNFLGEYAAITFCRGLNGCSAFAQTIF